MTSILARSSLRYLLRHPWQMGLSVLGVGLGVAVVVAIDLANASAQRAFEVAAENVTGRATHQVVGGPAGVANEVYRDIFLRAGVPAAPVVEVYALARSAAGVERTLTVLGLDPFAERPFRPYLRGALAGPEAGGFDLGSFLTEPGAVLLAAGTAGELGVGAGDELALTVAGRPRVARVAGLLRQGDALADLLIADVATAQELADRPGHLSRVDLILSADEGERAAQRRRLEALLPPGATIVAAAARTRTTAEMTRAFRLNLTALSLLALVCGTFLIYNTMTFSVVQRRPLIGTLRALGVTRRQIFRLVEGEALAVGVAGTALGLLLGVVLGRGLVELVTRTINDLYFVLSVRGLALSPWALVKGAALGTGATLAAALAPAVEATATAPRAALARSALEDALRRAVPRATAAGIALLVAGLGLLAPPGLLPSFIALFALIVGFALLTPLATVVLMGAAGPVLGRLFGILGRMAARGVVAALSRTAVAVAALMIAVSVTVGVGIMVDSFRGTVTRWLEMSLAADVYISPAGPAAGTGGAPLEPDLVARLAAAPGVERVNTLRALTLEGAGGERTRLVALDLDERDHASFDFADGDPEAAWRAFHEEGAVIVSEPYAYRHDLETGSAVRLRTDRGERDFPVAGIYYDYGSEQGAVMMSRRTFRRFFDDARFTAVAVFAAPAVEVEDLIAELRRRAGGGRELLVRSNRALKETSLEIFDRTFRITGVLRLLAGAVAFIGVLSALMALALERARELGVLRANGLTPRQLWRLVLAQTGLMGLAAGLLSLPVGTALAAVMIHVINRRSFGWTLAMEVAPAILLQALALALVAALLAGLYPAWRMARTPPALALREE